MADPARTPCFNWNRPDRIQHPWPGCEPMRQALPYALPSHWPLSGCNCARGASVRARLAGSTGPRHSHRNGRAKCLEASLSLARRDQFQRQDIAGNCRGPAGRLAQHRRHSRQPGSGLLGWHRSGRRRWPSWSATASGASLVCITGWPCWSHAATRSAATRRSPPLLQ